MATNNKAKDEQLFLDDVIIAAAIAQDYSSVSPVNGANDQPNASMMNNPLMELALLELGDRRKRKDAEAEETKRFLLARTQSHKDETIRKLAGQAACNHIKERGYGSRIGGQKLSNNSYIFMCQFCGKEWSELTLPPHLAIPMEFVGG